MRIIDDMSIMNYYISIGNDYNIKYMFVSPSPTQMETCQKLSQIEAQLGFQGNQYLFLRSIWKSHSHQSTHKHAVIDFDDQLDRLNKIVAMMKKHINYSVKKQLYYHNHSYSHQYQLTFKETKALEAMNKASLEAEQYRTRLAECVQENGQLKRINQQLKQEIHQLKRKRKDDTKQIKQLAQKNAILQNKILSTGYQQSKSQTSFMRTSRNFDKEASINKRQSLLNLSICQNSESLHIPTITKQKSENAKLCSGSRSRYSKQKMEQEDDRWLNQTSMIESNNLDQSMISVSSYGFNFQPQMQTSLLKISSHKQNKQNLCQSKIMFHYQSERNLCKQKSLKKSQVGIASRPDILGESPKQGLKFIRQNSKKTLLRKSQKLVQSRVIAQQCK